MSTRRKPKSVVASKTSPVLATPAAREERIREMSAEEFVRRLLDDEEAADKRFALFLGAGCSVSSGIPSAGPLVLERWLPRLHQLRAPHRPDLEQWAKEEIPGFNAKDGAASYGRLIDHLF